MHATLGHATCSPKTLALVSTRTHDGTLPRLELPLRAARTIRRRPMSSPTARGQACAWPTSLEPVCSEHQEQLKMSSSTRLVLLVSHTPARHQTALLLGTSCASRNTARRSRSVCCSVFDEFDHRMMLGTRLREAAADACWTNDGPCTRLSSAAHCRTRTAAAVGATALACGKRRRRRRHLRALSPPDINVSQRSARLSSARLSS